ncbi:MAG: hypothetical protein E7773_07725 [Sphingomonas sp.]|uniref:hypothetical protein n=1 Tax=Sphingomonas sp. TaxID=28214 RepID=UPI00121847DD|nr:hypothetical protein [Sphingomonas sp.]THD36391.1 MAG: hypothetical protein E7773_07725 [Sphingomonas sp.]
MKVEIFDDKEALEPMFVGEFPQLPRVGEYLSIDREGYFKYYRVVEIWHRIGSEDVIFQSCVRVELED